MIRQATIEDIPLISDIFFNVVLWMKENHLKQWRFRDLEWEKMSFNIHDFFICFDHKNNAVGFMILSPHDITTVWNTWQLSHPLYIYKLAIKREYAKLGFSTELINFSKVFAKKNSYSNLCLHCQAKRLKLRNLYESNDFVYIGENIIKNETDISAFYVYQMK